MSHNISEQGEKLLDKKFDILDFGFITLVDYLGNDDRIAESARVSYLNNEKKSNNEILIDYLIRNDHTSPFEQVVFTFHIKMPIFVARQWVRHRTARINEISGRYSVLKTEFYKPKREKVSYQSENNKQGRGNTVSDKDYIKFLELVDSSYKQAENSYNKLIELGIAKEIARTVLPLSVYTEFYWQIDLHNLFHFLKLRLDNHAQYEIREYSKILLQIIEKICPMATAAFKKHNLNGIKLSEEEANYIKNNVNIENSNLSERSKRILKEKFFN